ncbi:MAG: hypothetical protein ACRDRH_21690 [Pseudonocardia sp.]
MLDKAKDYARRVRQATLELRAAEAALAADHAARKAAGGPWGEDRTYLDLNDAVCAAEERRNKVLRGKAADR